MKTTTVLVLALCVLSGCTANIINLKPGDPPDAEVAALEQMIANARAAQQCEVLTLAEQARQVFLVVRELHDFQQWSYHERKNGKDYSEEMKERLRKAIRDNWKLGEEAVKLHSLAALYQSDLADAGKALAKVVFETADAGDDMYQLSLGYTIAGLQWNTDYLKKEKEDYLNALLQKEEAMGKKAMSLGKDFMVRIAAHPGKGNLTTCPDTLLLSNGKIDVPINVTFEDDSRANDSETKMLEETIAQIASNTFLTARKKKVTIALKVEAMDKYRIARYATNVLTFVAVGYVHLGGGNATFSSFVQEEGGEPIPLAVSTFDINAKSTEALTLLVASRIVGRAEFALLQKGMH